MNRKNFLKLMAGGALAIGTLPVLSAGDNMSDLARLNKYRSYRASSGNKDFTSNVDYLWVEPGETLTMFDVSGCGLISHIWMTTPGNLGSPASYYPGSLETTEIRMYWDGETDASVRSPLGAFFCAPFDTAREFISSPIVLNGLEARGFNMYFPMPFARSAKIELINHSATHRFRIYFHIDYVLFDDSASVDNQGRFHARYHQEQLKSNEPYVLLEQKGLGHYVGTVLFFDTGIRKDQAGYMEDMKKLFPDSRDARHWWEGDDRIYIDDELAIDGTGTEDYFGSAWSYADEKPFTAPKFGCVMNGYDPRDYGRWCLYRWHLDYPVAFRKSIKVTIEHGHNNAFIMVPYNSVAYWYQVMRQKIF